ncbi:MAG: ATP synthase subunit I [Candidatus Competibacteraceae bacterium]
MIENGLGLLAALGGWLLAYSILPGCGSPCDDCPATLIALWVAGSFVLRLAVSLTGFYVILGPDRNLIRLGIALLTFIAARVVLTRYLRPTPES